MDEIQKTHTPQELCRALRAAFPHTIPVLTGFTVLGMAYGVLMAANGYGVLWAALMSIFGFGGSIQYAVIPLLATAFEPVQALILSLMVNARHLFYGLSILEKYRGLGKIRPFLIYTLCDETFSIVSSVEPPEDVDRGLFYLFVSLLDYLCWVAATIAGALIGERITFDTTGLDFVLTALFVVLFMEQMKTRGNRRYGLIGLAASVAAVFLFGADNMVIPAMILILAVLLGLHRQALRPAAEENR